MKVVVFGGTGMIGQGVLHECLADPAVTEVAIGIYAEHFTAPVWRVTAVDVPA